MVLVREDVIIGGTLLRGRDDRWQVLNDAVQQFLELVQLRIRFNKKKVNFKKKLPLFSSIPMAR